MNHEVLDAKLVWNTWRKILSDGNLSNMVTQPGFNPAALSQHWSSTEKKIIAEYAKTPEATRINVFMYRRNLSRNAIVALNRIPLTQHLLLKSGLIIENVANDFIRFHDYTDDGPNFWHLAGALIQYFRTLPEFHASTSQDVLLLDYTLVALAKRLGKISINIWPDTIAQRLFIPTSDKQRFVACQASTIIQSKHDLTLWIENPQSFDPSEPLAQSTRYWLVYFPSANSDPAYAEVSERSARVFAQVAEPRTATEIAEALGNLSISDVHDVINNLSELGVVMPEEEPLKTSRFTSLTNPLSRHAYVSLDPAVEMITEKVAGYQLLCHNQLATGMAIPPGEGFADFFAALAEKPVSVDALHKTFDDHQLIDAILVALCQHGYLSLSASQAAGDTELDQLRQGAEIKRQKQLCQRITLNADNVSIEEICLMLEAESIPPVLHLVCASLAKAAPLLSELAKRRQAGKVVIHNAIVETYVIGASSPVLKSLRGLNAGVIISGVSWPLPQQPLKEIDVLTRAGVPVYAHMKPGRSFLDDKTRSTVMVWARSNHISGLVLDLYVNELWPGGDASTGDFKDVFAALAEMEAILGDVRVSNLPDDQVLLGKAALSCPQPMTDLEWNFRKAYLHWRLPILKGSEGDNTFSQTPEAEEKLIPFHRDLLPNHPELLNIRAGSLVVDFAGGNGRVARRLSPLVGKDGLIISVEMLPCVTDCARRFANDLGFKNLQFRTGLVERIPLPDGAADAAVNEWTGAIWQLDLGHSMLAEMARVVRRGGRIAVTHRLVSLSLFDLHNPWVQFDNIYSSMFGSFAYQDLDIIEEHVWGQKVASLAGERGSSWRKHYMPLVVNPFDVIYASDADPNPKVDIYLTIIAQRR